MWYSFKAYEVRREKINEEIRPNKYLGKTGICSRREADRLIEAGKVAVNGTTASMGMEVKPGQRVVCEGKAVGQEPGNGDRKSARQGQGSNDGRDGSGTDSVKHFPKVRPVLLMVNKPRGVVCTTSDKDWATNIAEFLKYLTRIYPIGRLDKDSEGPPLVTDQGDLVDEIMRTDNAHEKEYVMTVNRPVTKEFLRAMGGGVVILDTVTRSCETRATGIREFTIILTQGLNRQTRRMCEALGYQIRTLKRVRMMNLRPGNLRTGGCRKVTPTEYQQLLEPLESPNNISTGTREYDDAGILVDKERLDREVDP